jgi:gluconolactonase
MDKTTEQGEFFDSGERDPQTGVSRRRFLAGLGASAFAVGAGAALGADKLGPPSTVTTPPRDFSSSGAPTTYFWDPDVIAVDPSFNGLAQPNAPIQRLWTGALWAEGPAWNSVGKFLLWSDIPNSRQMRWIEDDGHVSVFRSPTNNSNGNMFDFQGRQLSCEHLTRRPRAL